MIHLLNALRRIRAADTRDCAGVNLFNEDGQIFLVRRSEGQGRDGEWEGPGGHIQANEEPEEGARREFGEEVGTCPKMRVLDRIESTTPNGATYTNVLALLTEPDWEPELNHEHDDWGWFDLDELPDPTNPGLRKALETFVDGEAEVVVPDSSSESARGS